jgi:transposase
MLPNRTGEFFKKVREIVQRHEDGEPLVPWELERVVLDAYHAGVQYGLETMQRAISEEGRKHERIA